MKDELEEFMDTEMFVSLITEETFYMTYAGSFRVGDVSFSMFFDDRETRIIQTNRIAEFKKLSRGDSRPT